MSTKNEWLNFCTQMHWQCLTSGNLYPRVLNQTVKIFSGAERRRTEAVFPSVSLKTNKNFITSKFPVLWLALPSSHMARSHGRPPPRLGIPPFLWPVMSLPSSATRSLNTPFNRLDMSSFLWWLPACLSCSCCVSESALNRVKRNSYVGLVWKLVKTSLSTTQKSHYSDNTPGRDQPDLPTCESH